MKDTLLTVRKEGITKEGIWRHNFMCQLRKKKRIENCLGTILVCKTTPNPPERIFTLTQGKEHVFHGNSCYTYYRKREEKKHEDERPNQCSASQSCHSVRSLHLRSHNEKRDPTPYLASRKPPNQLSKEGKELLGAIQK